MEDVNTMKPFMKLYIPIALETLFMMLAGMVDTIICSIRSGATPTISRKRSEKIYKNTESTTPITALKTAPSCLA